MNPLNAALDRTLGLEAAIAYLGMTAALEALNQPLPIIGRTPWVAYPGITHRTPTAPRLSKLVSIILNLLTPCPPTKKSDSLN